jgi:hypothetical protein
VILEQSPAPPTLHNPHPRQLLVRDSSTPRGGWCKKHPLAPHRGLARCSPRPRPRRWACDDGLATTALITPTRHRWLPSYAYDWCRSWSVTPSIRPAVMLAYSARRNGGGGHAAKPAPPPPPPPPTLLPGATPLATPPHGGPPGPGWRRRARPRTGTTAPPDREDFAPHPVVLIIGHIADRRGSA